jgi:hypothetical protein
MMKQYFASAEAKMEEKEMIEELERMERKHKEGEPQTMTSILQEDQREKEDKSSNKKTPSPPKKKRMKLQTDCDIGSSPALRKTVKKPKIEDKILQKMTPSPTKKIKRSQHLPSAGKKSPTTKKTTSNLTKKIKPPMIPCPGSKLQELHMELRNDSKDGNGTKVKKARMKIEEKLRREKRAELLEKIRKIRKIR